MNHTSKLSRLNNAATIIRKEKKVSLIRLAAYFNLCNEYARKEFKDIHEFFMDIRFDGKYFIAIDLDGGNGNGEAQSQEKPKQKQEVPA